MESAYYLIGFLVLQTIIFTFLYLIFIKHCDTNIEPKQSFGWDPVSEELIFKLERIEQELQSANMKIITLTNNMREMNSNIKDKDQEYDTNQMG